MAEACSTIPPVKLHAQIRHGIGGFGEDRNTAGHLSSLSTPFMCEILPQRHAWARAGFVMPTRNSSLLSGIRHRDHCGARSLIGGHSTDNLLALANQLGTPLHLSPVAEHLDASPLQVAVSLRVQRAKRLVEGTDLSIHLVAECAGFSSTRRMSAAFGRLYGRPPAAFRKNKAGCRLDSQGDTNDRKNLRHCQC